MAKIKSLFCLLGSDDALLTMQVLLSHKKRLPKTFFIINFSHLQKISKHSVILSDLHARFENQNNFYNAFLRDFMTESDKWANIDS